MDDSEKTPVGATSDNPKQKSTKHVARPKQVEPKITWKGHEEFRHDLFKLKVSSVRKDINRHKTGLPIFHNIEHCHFFHSHNSKGKPNEHCVAAAGHVHEIKVEVDKDGNLKAVCGPPVRKVTKKLRRGGSKKVLEPVRFFDPDNVHKRGSEWIVDDHRHEVEYLRSEQLLKNAKKTNADAVRVASMMMQQQSQHMQEKPSPGSGIAEA